MTSDSETIFEVERVRKNFGDLTAVAGVSLSIKRGEIKALMGANGSGKSTLCKLITGVYRPDEGEFRLRDRSFHGWAAPSEAKEHGIAVVHQEAPLIGNMSILDTIMLHKGYRPTWYGRIRWRQMRRESVGLVADVVSDRASLNRVCASLSDAERSLLALDLAIDKGTQLLILDEATAAIPQSTSDVLLERVRGLADAGMPVLMITHRIGEVRRYADTLAVLHDGRMLYDGTIDTLDDEDIVRMMLGGDSSAAVEQRVEYERTHRRDGAGQRRVSVSIRGLGGGRLAEMTADIHAGELVGLCGLPASGVQEVAAFIAGRDTPERGNVVVDDKELPTRYGPSEAIKFGIAMVPRDRSRDGGVKYLSIRENMTLPSAGRYWHKIGREREVVRGMIKMFDIHPPRQEVLMSRLSGGNQQKVIVSKWLLEDPKLLILDDPTYGIDPGSRRMIFAQIRKRMEQDGMCGLMLTTEPEQLAMHCDRVLAFRDGKIIAELAGEDLTPMNVVLYSSS